MAVWPAAAGRGACAGERRAQALRTRWEDGVRTTANVEAGLAAFEGVLEAFEGVLEAFDTMFSIGERVFEAFNTMFSIGERVFEAFNTMFSIGERVFEAFNTNFEAFNTMFSIVETMFEAFEKMFEACNIVSKAGFQREKSTSRTLPVVPLRAQTADTARARPAHSLFIGAAPILRVAPPRPRRHAVRPLSPLRWHAAPW